MVACMDSGIPAQPAAFRAGGGLQRSQDILRSGDPQDTHHSAHRDPLPDSRGANAQSRKQRPRIGRRDQGETCGSIVPAQVGTGEPANHETVGSPGDERRSHEPGKTEVARVLQPKCDGRSHDDEGIAHRIQQGAFAARRAKPSGNGAVEEVARDDPGHDGKGPNAPADLAPYPRDHQDEPGKGYSVRSPTPHVEGVLNI